MPIVPYSTAEKSTQSEPAERDDIEVDFRVDTDVAARLGVEESLAGSFAGWLSDKLDPTADRSIDPDFDPFDAIEGTGYADYADSFIHIRNREEFEKTRRRIDRELWRREQMEDQDFFSMANAANVAGNIAGDPTILLPGGVAARGVSLGRGALIAGGSAAVAGAGAAAVSETALQQLQETRTLEESLMTIGVTGLFGGALGAGGAVLGSGLEAASGRIGSRASAFEKTLDTYSSGSVGASQAGGVRSLSDEGLKSAFGMEKLLEPTSPILRAVASPSGETRRAMARLTEDALIRNKNMQGIASDVSVTRRIEMRRAGLSEALVGLDDSFLRYRSGGTGRGASMRAGMQDLTGNTGGKLTRSQFAEEVGRALIRGDKSDIAEVQTAAELIRKTVFDPLKEAAIENGLLPEGVSSQVAESYLTRIYNRDMIAARRKAYRDADGNLQEGFEDKLTRWLEGRQAAFAEEFKIAQSASRAARAALEEQKALAKQSGVKGADASFGAAVTKAEQKLSSAEAYQAELTALSGATPSELQSIASEITDRVLSHEDRGAVYRPVAIKRGPLKELTLTIPTEQIEEFLEKDAERVARIYHRVMSTDVEMTRMFGSPDMSETLQKIRDEYNILRRDVDSEAELAKLDKRMDRDLRDLTAVRDRIRGTYAMPDNPRGILYRTVRATKTLNYLRLLGGMTISALPDMMRPVFVHGPMRVMRAGLVPLVSNMKGVKLSANEAKIAGAALEMTLDNRAMQMADVADEFGYGTKFERGLDAATSKFGLLSLMSPWNDALKKFSGIITQTRTLEAVGKWGDDSISKREIERLAFLGIDRNMAGRINAQFREFGEDQGTLKWANTEAWSDTEAAEFYRAALGKEIDVTIVTPSQEKPLWMSSQLGQVIGQFQSFTVASMQRVLLAGLQQRDTAALAGLIGMTGFGMLAYVLKNMLYFGVNDGITELSDDPQQWIMEGLDRSGALGYAFTFDRALDVASRGNVSVRAAVGGEELSRFKQRQGVTGLLGPTVAGMQDLAIATGAMVSGEVSESDIHAMRRLVPTQNIFYWRWLFDEAEEGLAEAVAD